MSEGDGTWTVGSVLGQLGMVSHTLNYYAKRSPALFVVRMDKWQSELDFLRSEKRAPSQNIPFTMIGGRN